MHRSRLSVILIDCERDKAAIGAEFWSEALGMRAQSWGDDADAYKILEGTAAGIRIMLQRVDDAGRIHLDIETDDVEAEVRRLESLGARRKEQRESMCVMEAPSGHLLCVVPVHFDDFPANANLWES